MDFSTTPQPARPDDQLAPWEIFLAKQLVQDFLAAHVPLRGLDAEDMVQECLTHWWSQRRRYQEDRGASRATYMRSVVRAKLRDIERRMHAAKRGGYSEALSLNAPLGDDEGENLSLVEVVPNEDVEGSPEQAGERLALRSHIDRVMPLLSPRQRQLAEQLGSGAGMSEISRLLDVPRPTLYDELARIKKVFREQGLEEFLT